MTLPIPAAEPARTAGLAHSLVRKRRGVLWKVTGIALLILLLHIPLLMTRGVLLERQEFQAQATREIADVWGQAQTFVGPILAVPFTYTSPAARQRVVGGQVISVNELETLTAHAYFLPETLSVDVTVEPELRRRGIYDTVVYVTRLAARGQFRPDASRVGLDGARLQWNRAQVVLGVSDLGGVRSLSPWIQPDGSTTEFEAVDDAGTAVRLGARVDGVADGVEVSFDLQLVLQGSGRLAFAPVGKMTRVNVQSPWPDPSFIGASLPVTRNVTADGFSAEWESTHFTRGFGHAWTDRVMTVDAAHERMLGASYGVEFRQEVEGYRLVERARKYGVLFFVLVFAVFFLFESMAGLRIHPLQYLLVGAGLCLFFLGFLALSEVLPVAWAYFTAALACTGLVALYAWSFLRTGRRAAVIGTGLGLTYAYLYFVLRSQDYALLAGTAALFVVLGTIMFCTRRMNWYAVDLGNASADNSATSDQARAC